MDELSDELCSFCFFCDCVKDGDCELQALSKEYGVDQLPFDWCEELLPLDDSTGSVVRNPNKCIKCRRCIDICTNEQTVNALGMDRRGARIQVTPTLGGSLADSACVKCGKCIDACPTGAIFAKEDYDEMLYITRLDEGKKTVAQISPGMRVELARLLKMDEEALDVRSLAAGLRKIGVQYVVSDAYAVGAAKAEAVRTLEDALGRQEGVLLLSNSAPAIEFVRREFGTLGGELLTYSSSEQAFGKYAKGEWAERLGFQPQEVCTITLSEDASSKAEARQPQHMAGGVPMVDFALTPREVARLFNKTAVNPQRLAPVEFHEFGPVAGDIPAPMDKFLQATDCHAGVTEQDLPMNGGTVKAAVAHGLRSVREVLNQVQRGESPYRIIRLCS